ncbi:hypothetical protein [Legionella parisiensis]|uniref:Uncharacterized protein n=1 Tax=Legionella parisiensis TaxID=45071 RepID=A0A1E5JQ00_9GAMM|nr:hypothetical protein [Legionella parisiensis]KTD41372.1 hypothetical protein Lpar_2689 [Legionella parisiensis]OEH46118.1 hypothetical protein lpari_02851 [Legionella parisiensis]STX76325.1 SidC homolog [Legionella parisiensis]
MKRKNEEKLNLFDSLPNELIATIGRHVDKNKNQLENSNNFALTCSLFYNAYQQERLNHKRLVISLAKSVAEGNQDQSEATLQKHPELLLSRTTIVDQSGRIFRNTTVWEYTLWSLDVRYMASMMLKCLPQNKHGEEIRLVLNKQFEEIETQGVTYELDGVIHREKYYDFAIIATLNDYLNNFNRQEWTERDQWWSTKVGQVQKLLPAHVAQHYCDPEESLDPTPTFKKEKFTRSLNFYNWIDEDLKNWFLDSRLGVSFAMSRAWGEKAHSSSRGYFFGTSAARDAMIALHKARTEDLVLLKEQLQKPLLQSDTDANEKRLLIP